MSYAIYSEHPQSSTRRQDDWTRWSAWADSEAPWTGISVPAMAHILSLLPAERADITAVLDRGGLLTSEQTERVNQLVQPDEQVADQIKKVLAHAVGHHFPVRVEVYESFGSGVASEYLIRSASWS
ncbi:MAG: hypothetical protein WCG47_04960 [Dermatophilaceae bacterium]